MTTNDDIHVYYDDFYVVGFSYCFGSNVKFILFDVTMIVGQMRVGDKK